LENENAEQRLFGVLAHQIEPKWMVDIGAHRGTMFLPFLQAGWRIDAFEPFTSSFEWLESQFGQNERVVLHPEAVSDTSATKAFHLATSVDGEQPHDFYHSLEVLRDDDFHRKGDTVEVTTVCIDDLVERGELPPEVGVLKIDTEGHDLQVLKGAGRLSAEVVSVEFWCPEHPQGPSPYPPEEIVELMQGRGYSNYIVVEHDLADNARFRASLSDVPPEAWGNLLFFRSKIGPYVSTWEWWGTQHHLHLESDLAKAEQALVEKEKVIREQENAMRELAAGLDALRTQLASLMVQLESVRSVGGAGKNLTRQVHRTLGDLKRRAYGVKRS
jgi:FkbM family methyltransferase